MTKCEATYKNVCYTLPAAAGVEQPGWGCSSPPNKTWKQHPPVSRKTSAPDRAAARARFSFALAATSMARSLLAGQRLGRRDQKQVRLIQTSHYVSIT